MNPSGSDPQLSQAAKLRSASVGALPREKKHFTSRNESANAIALDVRCACQYFQCDSLLPERVNPAGSRPESNIGFTSNIPGKTNHQEYDQMSTQSYAIPTTTMHDRHRDADRISSRSFGGQRSFDQISNKSFGFDTSRQLDLEELSRQGLVVRSITEDDSMQRNQREMSSDRISNRSFSMRKDPDTISHRSFSGLRRIESRSGSKSDLYVADICIPTTNVGIHSRRSSRSEIPHFNLISATPTPIGGSKPDFSVYEEFRKNRSGLDGQNKENIQITSNQRQGVVKQTSLPSRIDQRISDEICRGLEIPELPPVYQTTTVPSSQKQIEIQTISITQETIITESQHDPIGPDPQLIIEEGIRAESRPSSPAATPRSGSPNARLSPVPQLPQFQLPNSNFMEMNTSSPPGSTSFRSMRQSPPPASPTRSNFNEMNTTSSPPASPRRLNLNEMNTTSSPPSSPRRSNFNEMNTTSSPPGSPRRSNFNEMNITSSPPGSPRRPNFNEMNTTSSPPASPRRSNFNEMNTTSSPPASPTFRSNFGFNDIKASSPPASPTFRSNSNFNEMKTSLESSTSQKSNLYSASIYKDQQKSDQTVLHATLSIPSGRMSPQTTTYMVSGTATSLEALNSPPHSPKFPGKDSDHLKVPTSHSMQLKRQHPTDEFSASTLDRKQQALADNTNRKNSGRERSPFKFFGSIRKKSIDRNAATPERIQKEKSPTKERSPFRLFNRGGNGKSEIKEKSPAPERLSPKLLTKIEKNGKITKEKSPMRDRSPSIFAGSRRKSSSRPELIMMSDNNQVMSMGGPQKVSITKDTAKNQPTASAVSETFSLKVEELDQYAPKPKQIVTSNTSNRASNQKLKISNINLHDIPSQDSESRMNWSREPSPFQPMVDSDYQQPTLFISRQITSSNPNISTLSQRSGSEIRDHNTYAPAGINQNRNLVSVPIGIPQPVDYLDERTDPDIFYNEEKQFESRGEISQLHMKRQGSEGRQISRVPSEQRIMQSTLIKRKNYERTRSQDRGNSSQDSCTDSLMGRIAKTVSFDFAGHQSRLDDHDKLKSPNSSKALEKTDWLDRTYFTRDHEYEPIGEPQQNATTTSILKKEPSPAPQFLPTLQVSVSQPMDIDQESAATAEQIQKDMEERYFSSVTTTPRSESRTDYEIHTSQVDTSALEELPLKGENRRKSLMASAQDRSRKFKAGIRNQAGKMKTKIRSIKKPTLKKSTSGQKDKVEVETITTTETIETENTNDEEIPEKIIIVKEKRKFKAPEFSKMKMPDMPKFKSPDMSKFKTPDFKKIEFKRPEFTKVDMSKFKIPEKFSSLKLTRSKSFKEEAISVETGESGTTPESGALPEKTTPSKKKFEFSFGTYPRALRRKKIKDSLEHIPRSNELSTQQSNESPPSVESATPIPRGARDQGPVGSRWADKFSDVSYGGDSESGRFQRYGSEIESFERESSMERRMKDDLAAQEESELAIIATPGHKQFADYDEENRAIHEISKIREGEFKQRRPMVHQDSNISEESKDIGWSDKDALRNKLLRRAEIESEGYSNNYPSEEALTGSMNHETQSTGSSNFKKGVIEEIDDDEFFLRKRGISQDNIEIRKYISTAIREGFDNPINALEQLGSSQGEYPDSMIGISNDRVDYGYDAPPPPRKPRRHKQKFNNFERGTGDSQEFDIEQKENYDDNISLPQTGSDYFQNIPPNRPLRKSKKGYSQDSQSDIQNIPYFEDIDKEFYQRKEINLEDPNIMVAAYNYEEDLAFQDMSAKPKAPKRRKKQIRASEERELIMNGFGGRSISNSYLKDDNQPEEMIVYRTEHKYDIPLAQPEESVTTTPDPNIRRSRSRTNNEDEDRTSHGADSFNSDGVIIMENEVDEQKFTVEIKENDGYATVRKEPPPRPPPPSRHKRSAGDRFSTMPLPKGTPPPARPKRNYSTIGPARPPRRKSSIDSIENQNILGSGVCEYEELEDHMMDRSESPKHLQSGDVINKMKYRPLPPPPRPPRERKGKPSKNKEQFDDHDGDGERIISDVHRNGNYNIQKNMDKTIEVEISTQTDPLPDDFVFEEFEITDDMKIIEARHSKTLEDILREENDSEMERVKWTSPSSREDSLTRGLQRFRESNQRSLSEKSRASSAADRSKSHSRPHTPSAILIEKRVPTPVPNSRTNETILAASLTVQPIDDIDFEDNLRDEYEHSQGGDGSYEESTSYQASTVKSIGSHGSHEEEDRLKEFMAEEQRIREEEETQRINEELRRIQLEREEEEERLIMEKIRELQRLEEEEERKTMEKLKELELMEQQEKKRLQKQQEEDERNKREEQDRRILDKIKELEQQEEEDRRIMEKLRQLEQEFAESDKESDQPPIKLDFLTKPHHVEELTAQETIPDVEMELLEPPNRPPRKRSTPNVPIEERPSESIDEAATAIAPVIAKSITQTSSESQKAVGKSILPDHMAVADLEVERLRVHALQAGHIMVSNLHGSRIGADELECKSGNLVVRNLELPDGFIEEIVERVRSTERHHAQVETQTIETGGQQPESQRPQIHPSQLYEQRPFIPEDLPPRPPLPSMFPSEYMHSIPPAAFYELRDPDEEYQPNLQAPRRRRHHRRRDSSSDEENHRHRSRSRRSPEPSVAQLGGQFLQACGTSLVQRMTHVASLVSSTNENKPNQRSMSTLIVIFILMTVGFLLMAMSGKNIHHHHWDFFNPPNNTGRGQM